MSLKAYNAKQPFISAGTAIDGYYLLRVGFRQRLNQENYLPFALKNYVVYIKLELLTPASFGPSHIRGGLKSSSRFRIPFQKGSFYNKLSKSNMWWHTNNVRNVQNHT